MICNGCSGGDAETLFAVKVASNRESEEKDEYCIYIMLWNLNPPFALLALAFVPRAGLGTVEMKVNSSAESKKLRGPVPRCFVLKSGVCLSVQKRNRTPRLLAAE